MFYKLNLIRNSSWVPSLTIKIGSAEKLDAPFIFGSSILNART